MLKLFFYSKSREYRAVKNELVTVQKENRTIVFRNRRLEDENHHLKNDLCAANARSNDYWVECVRLQRVVESFHKKYGDVATIGGHTDIDLGAMLKCTTGDLLHEKK